MKNHQLTVVRKTRKELNNNNNNNKRELAELWTLPFDIVKLKEREKNDKYPDLARELKKKWNMKVMVIPIVNDALGTITKGLIKGLEDLERRGRVKTFQTTALLRLTRIQKRVPRTWRDLVSLNLQWETIH